MTKAYNAGFADDPKNPVYSTGKVLKTIVCPFATTATANDYAVLAQSLPATAIIRAIRLPRGSSAISGCTDVDFGIYAHEGAVLDKDALADGVSFGSAKTGYQDLLGASVASFDYNKNLAEILGTTPDKQPIGGYDICATINTGAAGNVYCEIVVELA